MLTKTQRSILHMLGAGMTVQEIAKERGVTDKSVYQVLGRLVAQGLVEKRFTTSFRIKRS